MNYQHYRGDIPDPPPWLRRHLYKLRYLGTLMIISTPVIGWLTVLKIIQISFFLYLVASFNMAGGMIFYLIGMVYDNAIDRSE